MASFPITSLALLRAIGHSLAIGAVENTLFKRPLSGLYASDTVGDIVHRVYFKEVSSIHKQPFAFAG
jgi:hypothetical protein